uniref:hypothetical protein n=1 Tax=Paractinoplanes polyasparticus TaxID=2856853 RepID=UPI001C855167|nr:hypothetical protein [Actinoplanes polyasparticus]
MYRPIVRAAIVTLVSARTPSMAIAEVAAAAVSAIGVLFGAALLTIRFLLRPRRRR